jgi:hypothetical protein
MRVWIVSVPPIMHRHESTQADVAPVHLDVDQNADCESIGGQP